MFKRNEGRHRASARVSATILAVLGMVLAFLIAVPGQPTANGWGADGNEWFSSNGAYLTVEDASKGFDISPASVEAVLYGPYNGARVGSENLCVEQGNAVYSSGLPVELASDRWDYSELFIAHETDFDLGACWQYNYGQRMSFEIVNKPNGHCYHSYTTWNSVTRTWTRYITYLNVYYQDCWSTSLKRERFPAAAMGYWLGLDYNNLSPSVMNPNQPIAGPSLTHDIPNVNYLYNF